MGTLTPPCIVRKDPGVHGWVIVVYDWSMKETRRRPTGLRVVVLSAVSAVIAPLVFVTIIVLRKAERRFHVQFEHWNKRLQHEIARWS
jgi:hypothetical protein